MGVSRKFRPDPSKRLMDQVREVLRFHHYAYRTDQAYCQWIVRFIKFFLSKTHSREMGVPHVEQFLSHLASERSVSASTQRQALNALVFLYHKVLHQPLGELGEFARARRLPCVSEVLSRL